MTKITRALIVRAPYAGMIVDGLKTWEMRSRHVSENLCRRIGIIESGSGTVIGEADLLVSVKLDFGYLKHCVHKHQVDDFKLLKKWNVAWILKNAVRYYKPVPYVHPRGAVVWVDLNKQDKVGL